MEYCYVVPKDDELMHYGIKGMHWGIRRYQNANGTLTSEGKAHVKEWKSKEIARRSLGYDKAYSKIRKKESRLIEKQREKIKEGKDVSKLTQKIDGMTAAKHAIKALKKAEINKIGKMNINDISQAKKNKAKFAAKEALKYIGKASAATAAGFAGGFAGGAMMAKGMGLHSMVVNGVTHIFPVITNSTLFGAGAATVAGATGAEAALKIKSAVTGLTSRKHYSNLTSAERDKIISKFYPKDANARSRMNKTLKKRSRGH